MNDRKKTLTYSIERINSGGARGYVGGFADRLKGICFAYSVALLTDRSFHIEWSRPCPLEDLLSQSMRDWRIDESLKASIAATASRFDWVDSGFSAELSTKFGTPHENLDHMLFEDIDDVVLHVNSFRLDSLATHRQRLLTLGVDSQSPRHCFASVFPHLFSIEPIKQQPRWEEFESFRRSVPILVGGQFRTGAGIGWNDPALDDIANSEAFAASLIKFGRSRGLSDFGVFLTSDNEEALQRISKALPSELQKFTYPGPRVHMERSPEALARSHAKQIALEFVALGECDHVIIGAGAFGMNAAFRLGKSPVHYKSLQ
jgi:hypothetical protein